MDCGFLSDYNLDQIYTYNWFLVRRLFFYCNAMHETKLATHVLLSRLDTSCSVSQKTIHDF